MTTYNEHVYTIRMSITSLNDGRILYDNFDTKDEPMHIVPDKGYLFPKLEQELNSLCVGERLQIYLMAHEAFGEHNRKAIKTIPVEHLPTDEITLGHELAVKLSDGMIITGKVLDINEEHAQIDFNHPFADQDVKIDILLENVVHFRPH